MCVVLCTQEEVPLPSIGWRNKERMRCGSMAVDVPQGRGNTFRLSHSPSRASVHDRRVLEKRDQACETCLPPLQ